MRKELAAAAKNLDDARKALADNPKSNKALMALVDAEDAYRLRVAVAWSLAHVG
jgi:hypothetical protein